MELVRALLALEFWKSPWEYRSKTRVTEDLSIYDTRFHGEQYERLLVTKPPAHLPRFLLEAYESLLFFVYDETHHQRHNTGDKRSKRTPWWPNEGDHLMHLKRQSLDECLSGVLHLMNTTDRILPDAFSLDDKLRVFHLAWVFRDALIARGEALDDHEVDPWRKMTPEECDWFVPAHWLTHLHGAGRICDGELITVLLSKANPIYTEIGHDELMVALSKSQALGFPAQ